MCRGFQDLSIKPYNLFLFSVSLGVIVGAAVGGVLILIITVVGIILCIRLRAPRVRIQPTAPRAPYGQPFQRPVVRRFVPNPFARVQGLARA